MKRMTKVLALLLVLVLAMGTLAACGNKKTEEGTKNETTNTDTTNNTENTDTTDEGGEEVAEDWTWPLEETEELSFWIVWSSSFFTDPNELIDIQEIE